MFTHNWWHIALFYLDKGDTDQVLIIYDTHLWGAPQGDPNYSQDQAGALSMLIRLSLRGVDLHHRWGDVADAILERGVMYDKPFLTAHFSYALARSEHRTAYEGFLRELEGHASEGNATTRHLWLAYALPLCRGMGAHADNNFYLAARLSGRNPAPLASAGRQPCAARSVRAGLYRRADPILACKRCRAAIGSTGSGAARGSGA
jgi:hypothetical protein